MITGERQLLHPDGMSGQRGTGAGRSCVGPHAVGQMHFYHIQTRCSIPCLICAVCSCVPS